MDTLGRYLGLDRAVRARYPVPILNIKSEYKSEFAECKIIITREN